VNARSPIASDAAHRLEVVALLAPEESTALERSGCPLRDGGAGSCQSRSCRRRRHGAPRSDFEVDTTAHAADVLQGGQPHERRLGTLVVVDAGRGQAIVAASFQWIGDREAQIVPAEELGVGGFRGSAVAIRMRGFPGDLGCEQ
jgi:hypothetical protein